MNRKRIVTQALVFLLLAGMATIAFGWGGGSGGAWGAIRDYFKRINTTAKPAADATYDIGSTSSGWDQAYFSGVNAAGGSKDVLTLDGTLGIMNNSDTFRGIYLNYTNANHTGSGNTVYGLDIAGITQDDHATETAIHIGSGWDNALDVSGAAIIGGDITISDTTPVLNFKDSSCTDADVNASIQADASATTADHEYVDVTFQTQIDGTATNYLVIDADAATTLGATTDIYLDPEGLDIIIGDSANEDCTLQFTGDTSTGVFNYDEDNSDLEWDQNLHLSAAGGAADNVIPDFQIVADADSDGSANITSDTFQIKLTADATPGNAVWTFTNTQAAGYTFDDNITAVGSFIIGSADMDETDLEKLDGITNGTAAANKALVLDAGSDITTGLDSFTATTLTDGTASLNSGTLTGITTAITGTKNNALTISIPGQSTDSAAGQGMTISADDGGSGGTGYAGGNMLIEPGAAAGSGNNSGGILTLRGGAKSASGADGYVRITEATDTPTQTLDDESLYVVGKLEVDGMIHADGGVTGALTGTASGNANLALSNLASVAVSESLTSDTAATDDLGTAALYWRKLYLGSEIFFEGSTDNTFNTTFSITDPTTPNKVVTFRDATGTVLLSGDALTGDVTATFGTGGTTATTIAADSVDASMINTVGCGTNCTWDTTADEVDVDDAFVVNSGADEMTGALTCDGIVMDDNHTIGWGGDESITFDGTDFQFTDSIDMGTNIWTDTLAGYVDQDVQSGTTPTFGGANITVVATGDAAIDFFGSGVDAVTDTTTCTDIEGTLLSITGSTLNCVEAQTLAAVLVLGADGNDVDQTSLGKLEFFDAGLYLDADADGVMDITSDGTLELHSADWDISTTGAITNTEIDADNNTVSNIAIGAECTGASTDLTDTANILLLDAGGTLTANVIANANLSVGNAATTAGVLTLLEDDDDGSNFASFMVPALGANTVYTLPPDDGDANEVLKTDGNGVLDWTIVGAATAYDDIGDPDASSAITFNDTETITYTTEQNTASNFFTIDNTVADVTGQVYLLNLDYSVDDNQALADYMQCQDAGGVVFSIQQDGDTTIAGTLGVTGAITGTTVVVNTLLDVNEEIDIDLDAADEEITITQSNVAGTEGVPLIYIDDDRTGTTANSSTEASLVIDAEGTYALYVPNGMSWYVDFVIYGSGMASTPDAITATGEGVAASNANMNTEVTTNGDSDEDNVTLADGITDGQIKHIYCVAEGNAEDTWKITPTQLAGGTQITFDGIGEGCTLVYDSGTTFWIVTGNNGGTIS